MSEIVNMRKLTEKEFLTALRENSGLYSRTARAIRNKYNIDYSRQAVRQRAENYPEELSDIEEENIDTAEGGLHDLMNSENESIKFRAIELYLKTKGRSRGYNQEKETESVNIYNNMSEEQRNKEVERAIENLKKIEVNR